MPALLGVSFTLFLSRLFVDESLSSRVAQFSGRKMRSSSSQEEKEKEEEEETCACVCVCALRDASRGASGLANRLAR